jgi:hypothetical protein
MHCWRIGVDERRNAVVANAIQCVRIGSRQTIREVRSCSVDTDALLVTFVMRYSDFQKSLQELVVMTRR